MVQRPIYNQNNLKFPTETQNSTFTTLNTKPMIQTIDVNLMKLDTHQQLQLDSAHILDKQQLANPTRFFNICPEDDSE